jgi:hypothetical protein
LGVLQPCSQFFGTDWKGLLRKNALANYAFVADDEAK